MSKNEINEPVLTTEERQQLRLWLSATPLQRLNWLEEAQKIADKSGALKRYKESGEGFEQVSPG